MKAKDSRKEFLILFLTIAVIVGSLVLYNQLHNRVKFENPGMTGNTAGNLHNLGLFCYNDGIIYFSNPNDDGVIYSMTEDLSDFKRFTNDNARYINADSSYVYYARMNNLKKKKSDTFFVFFKNGIARVNKKGKNLNLLWNKPIGSMVLNDNKIVYQHYEKGKDQSVYIIGIDGSDNIQIAEDNSSAVAACDEKVFYTGSLKDHKLHSINCLDMTEKVELEIPMYLPIVKDNCIYYISTQDKYRLYKCNRDGSNAEMLTQKSCSAYNVSEDGRYIYYQSDDRKEAGIYLKDTVSDREEKLLAGNFKWINLAGEYCFFYSFDESKIYVYSPDAGLKEFNPPDLS